MQKKNNKPQILYKYMPSESLKKILTNKSLKITNPKTFNDPFDCNIPKSPFKSQDTTKEDKDFLEIWNDVIPNFRILSLTNTSKNILMWSHYADLYSPEVLKHKYH